MGLMVVVMTNLGETAGCTSRESLHFTAKALIEIFSSQPLPSIGKLDYIHIFFLGCIYLNFIENVHDWSSGVLDVM
jgi:hypothetical protein